MVVTPTTSPPKAANWRWGLGPTTSGPWRPQRQPKWRPAIRVSHVRFQTTAALVSVRRRGPENPSDDNSTGFGSSGFQCTSLPIRGVHGVGRRCHQRMPGPRPHKQSVRPCPPSVPSIVHLVGPPRSSHGIVRYGSVINGSFAEPVSACPFPIYRITTHHPSLPSFECSHRLIGVTAQRPPC